MIRHVTVFSWVPDASEEARKLVAERLNGLSALLTGLVSFTCGDDAGLVDGNGDFAVVADFEDADSYFAYRDHPVHQEIIRTVTGPLTRQRLTVQFSL